MEPMTGYELLKQVRGDKSLASCERVRGAA
jgi:hypothetical protein